MAFRNLYGQVSKNLERYRELQEQISKERTLLNPSDDPAGTSLYARYQIDLSATQRYQDNMDDADQYLTATEQCLQELSNLLTRAREVAELNATDTADSSVHQVGSTEVDDILDQMFQTLNTKQNNRYLFSGYNTDEQAYLGYGRILPGYAAQANTYEGEMTTSGEFTGDTQKEYLIRIISGGDLGTAQYQISEDGGETWGSELTLTGNIAVHDDVNGEDLGVQASFTAGTFAEGDEFKVYVRAGSYSGDDGQIDFNLSRTTRITTNVTGLQAAEDTGLIDTMYNLKIALENNDTPAISAALEDLRDVQDTFENILAETGLRMNRIEVARNNMVATEENLLSSIESISQPDLIDAISELSMVETALSASTSVLGSILTDSLLNYI
jgi:flagellar hook-associated protein 3 FlgL